MFHEPVLVKQVVGYLIGDRNGVYVDGTLGGAGHAQAILESLGRRSKLVALDRDDDAITYAKQKLQPFADKVIIRKSNFKDLGQVLEELRMKRIHGLFLDLGVSSHQIDTAERGFSYSLAGDLDMRMNRQQALTAKEIVNTYSEGDLSALFKKYGQERKSRAAARSIVKGRKLSAITTTQALKRTVGRVLPPEYRIKSLARIFQALRIAVNDELRNLTDALNSCLDHLLPGGRIVVISYHSLEDRLVKDFLKWESAGCVCPPELPVCVCGKKSRIKILTKRPVRPSEHERRLNPRSRSAKLRAAEKL